MFWYKKYFLKNKKIYYFNIFQSKIFFEKQLYDTFKYPLNYEFSSCFYFLYSLNKISFQLSNIFFNNFILF